MLKSGFACATFAQSLSRPDLAQSNNSANFSFVPHFNLLAAVSLLAAVLPGMVVAAPVSVCPLPAEGTSAEPLAFPLVVAGATGVLT